MLLDRFFVVLTSFSEPSWGHVGSLFHYSGGSVRQLCYAWGDLFGHTGGSVRQLCYDWGDLFGHRLDYMPLIIMIAFTVQQASLKEIPLYINDDQLVKGCIWVVGKSVADDSIADTSAAQR